MAWFLASYALSGGICLLAILAKNEKARIFTKILIVPSLMGFFVAGKGLDLLPLAALTFGWLGDLFLIKKGKKAFLLGLASFLIGHLFYLLCFIQKSGLSFPPGKAAVPAIAIAGVLAVTLSVPVYRLIRPFKDMAVPVIVYMIALESMCLAGFSLFLAEKTPAAFLIMAGCLLFLLSDTTLGYFRFRKRPPSANFVIMGTYLLAQAGIIGGLVLL